MHKNDQNSISESEATLLKEFRRMSLENGEGEIAPDGLMFLGDICASENGDWYRLRGDEESLWLADEVKLMILTKEQNEPDDYYDVRSTPGFAKGSNPQIKGKFFTNLAGIVLGLRTKSSEYLPTMAKDMLVRFPYVRINVKKQPAGGSESDNFEELARKYEPYTLRQISLYGAKIIFNGAGIVGMELLKQLYPDLESYCTSQDTAPFKPREWNRWIWHSKDVLVINGHHPSSRFSAKDYYASFMTPYLEFLSSK